jgi:hypothetical protein
MTFQEKVAKMHAALRQEHDTLRARNKSTAANAIADYLETAPANSLARFYDILTEPTALAKKEG